MNSLSHDFLELVGDYWDEVVLALYAGGLATLDLLVPQAFINEHEWLFKGGIIVGGAFALAALYRNIGNQGKISRLSDQNAALKEEVRKYEQDIEELVLGYLLTIAEQLSFGAEEGEFERITLYFHLDGEGEGDEMFLPFKRHSTNPQLKKKGRDAYPVTQGVIGEAWRKGSHCEESLPDPEAQWKEYVSRLEGQGFSKQDVQRLRMQSRFLYGWRVKDTTAKNWLAVIVVEATKPSRWSREEIEQVFRKNKIALRELMERVEPRRADNVKRARRLGL